MAKLRPLCAFYSFLSEKLGIVLSCKLFSYSSANYKTRVITLVTNKKRYKLIVN